MAADMLVEQLSAEAKDLATSFVKDGCFKRKLTVAFCSDGATNYISFEEKEVPCDYKEFVSVLDQLKSTKVHNCTFEVSTYDPKYPNYDECECLNCWHDRDGFVQANGDPFECLEDNKIRTATLTISVVYHATQKEKLQSRINEKIAERFELLRQLAAVNDRIAALEAQLAAMP
jgi:hypothetical protein